jgi:hypothetical protein
MLNTHKAYLMMKHAKMLKIEKGKYKMMNKIK